MIIDSKQFESMRKAGAYLARKKEERSQKWLRIEVILLFLAMVGYISVVLVEVLK